MLIKNASAKQIILKPSRFFWRVDILRKGVDTLKNSYRNIFFVQPTGGVHFAESPKYGILLFFA